VKSVTATQPKLEKEIRLTMEDRVSLPRVYLTWHSAPQFSADEAPLDVLAAILADGKSSRLYKSLVYEKQIAQDVNAFNNAREIAGTLQITATAKPGQTMEAIEQAIGAELAKIRESAPSEEEVQRAFNNTEASVIFALQTVGGFGGKSDQLNYYATFRNDPGYLARDLARYRAVTASDVHRVARKYLTPGRLVLTVVPATGDAKPAEPAAVAPKQTAADSSEKAAQAAAKPSKEVLPKPASDPKMTLPAIQRRRLSNGLEVLIVEHHELPVVGIGMVVKNGAAAEPPQLAGIATLTADLVDEGTAKRSALQLSDDLANIGARLRTHADWDSSGLSMLTLKRHLDKALDLFADVATNASFPEKEVKRLQQQRLTALKQRRDNANDIASDVYARLLYGADHPYGHPILGNDATINAIDAAAIRRFYQTYYRPGGSTLLIVGDTTPEAIMPKLEKAFGSWKTGEIPAVTVSTPSPRENTTIYLVNKPGAAQSVISVGQIGVARSTADYFPLVVMNTMLGGQFTSRLNMNLRENKGYTYGARSSFDYRRSAGPFAATAGVQTAVTKESVQEFLRELRGIRGDMPVSDAELDFAKQSIIRGFPRTFETPEQIGGRLTDLVLHGLPDNYFNQYIQRIAAVTKDDVRRVAQKYLDPGKMAILVVGDEKVIGPGLRSLEELGTTVTVLDAEGKPLTGAP
jgi:zinc protease